MTLTWSIILLFLHRGVVGHQEGVGDLPPCFSQEITWHTVPDDAIKNIETPFICQDLCAVSDTCYGFTWYSELHEHFPKLCALYSTLAMEDPCTHCISGPVSCTCSGYYGCDLTSDNVIDIFTSIDSETRCQNICFNTPGCNFYTYYNDLNVMQEMCYIFNSCEQIDESCIGCFSGPSECAASTTTTHNTATFPLLTTTVNHAPIGCNAINYTILNDTTRNANYGSGYFCDDDDYNPSPDWEGAGWYRLDEPAGTTIPESPPDEWHCGTAVPGWMQGQHPDDTLEEVRRTVCFNLGNGDTCWRSIEIDVRNCGDYYLYNLPEVPNCKLRYCAV